MNNGNILKRLEEFDLDDEELRGMSAEDLCDFFNYLLSGPYFCIFNGTLRRNNKTRNKACFHGRIAMFCGDCGGKHACEHKIQRSSCRECSKHDYCVHNIRKTECIECENSLFCSHRFKQTRCKRCRSKVDDNAKTENTQPTINSSECETLVERCPISEEQKEDVRQRMSLKRILNEISAPEDNEEDLSAACKLRCLWNLKSVKV